MLKLEDFKAAKKRVDEVILPTHLIHSDAFSEECGNDVYIKPENLQKTGAFKIRGAYNKIMKLDDEAKKRGLIASSAGNHAQGVIFSGLTNIVGDNASGVLIGGLLNIAGENSSGAHIAGLANISGEDFIGITASGLLNIVGENLRGVQISGLGNITGENMQGLQISGLGNVVGEHFTGAQIAPFNFAGKGKGVQIGLVNYYKNSFDGFQLGLVNANPDTKVQLMLFGGNATKLNVGARFKNNLFYTILGGGTHYLDFSDKFSASLFYRAGLELPLYKQLFISGDLGFQHIENFKNKDYSFPTRLYALQARVNLEYRLNDRLGVFVTGGYGGSRYYTKGGTYDKGVIVEGGVVLFKY